MNFAQWLGFLALITLLYALWQVKQMLMLFFAAIVIAVAIDTLASLPQRYGIRRGPALVMTALTVLVGTILIGLLIVPPLLTQFGQLATTLPSGVSQAERLVDDLYQKLPFPASPPSLQELFNTISTQVRPVFSQSIAFFSSLLNTVFGVLIVFALTSLLLADPHAYTQAFVNLFPAFYRHRIAFILVRCKAALQNWLIGIMITSSLVMLLSATALWMLGVPLVLANAALAGLLNLIPNIGPTLSVIAPMMVALTISPWLPLWVLLSYIIIQQIESHLLTPFVMSRQLPLLPGLILLAQIFFTTFVGVLGLFLSVPLSAILQIWIQEVVVRDVLDRWQNPRYLPPADLQHLEEIHSQPRLAASPPQGDALAEQPLSRSPNWVSRLLQLWTTVKGRMDR